MATEERRSVKIINQQGPTGFVLIVAFVGALVYFLQQAHTFGEVLVAIIEAIVWPGIVLYHVLALLGA